MVIYKAEYIIIRNTIPMFKIQNLTFKSKKILSKQKLLQDKTTFPLLIYNITPTFKLKPTLDE